MQFHVDEFFACGEAAGDLVDAGGSAGFYGEVFGLDAFRGDFWLDGFGDFVHGETQCVRDHGYRFGQAYVLDGAFGDFLAEFLDGQAGANFFLQRQTAF